ncbi:MAG TPA: HAD-IIIA family hydrolase [Planctomycetota bacterium]|nr:HAD-IIIA family hydrolase [Planctomycetota bacterium]HQB00125.1 HAD-IIIA family hydrolase [Planctomycetota bacterium]
MQNRFLLLDRDGVLIDNDCYYVTAIQQVRLLDGVQNAIQRLKEFHYKLCVVSNQGGISKGLYTKKTVDEIHVYLENLLDMQGSIFWYYCPHHDKDFCNCRKPKAGLLQQAISDFSIPTEDLWMVGDSKIDILAGKKVNCKTALVQTGNGLKQIFSTWEKPDKIFQDFATFVDFLLETHEK